MQNDLEDRIKEKLLEGLIEHMEDRMGSDMEAKFPKAPMEVSVGAATKEGLAEGLDHAKKIAEGSPPDMDGDGDGDDEARLMAMMGKDDDDDEMMR